MTTNVFVHNGKRRIEHTHNFLFVFVVVHMPHIVLKQLNKPKYNTNIFAEYFMSTFIFFFYSQIYFNEISRSPNAIDHIRQNEFV